MINGSVRDISKRHVSNQLVDPATGCEGPVIVKTNEKCFGARHAVRKGTWRSDAWWLYARLVEFAFPLRRSMRRLHAYPIYDDFRQVPRKVWRDRKLVVERFLPERDGGFYCLRTWVFLGTREKVSLSRSPEPVVKRANIVTSEFTVEVSEEIRAARRRLGFDYSKFDFVLHEGKPVLLDTNSTPTSSGQPSPRLNAMSWPLDCWIAPLRLDRDDASRAQACSGNESG